MAGMVGLSKTFFPSFSQGSSCPALGEQTKGSKRSYLAGRFLPSMMSCDENKKAKNNIAGRAGMVGLSKDFFS